MTIAERCYQLAEQAKTSAKSMHCRANADARAAALKAANVYVMAAGWSETMTTAALAERCRAQAAAYMASGKAYKPGPKRSEYVRGAAVLIEVAEWAERDEISNAILRACDVIADHDKAMAITSVDADAVETLTYTDDETVQATPRRRYTRRTPPAQAHDAATSTSPRTSGMASAAATEE